MRHWTGLIGAMVLVASAAGAQVATGGGGAPGPGQFASVAAPFDRGIFVADGRALTAAQRVERDAAWRAEIRKELFVPEALPALDVRKGGGNISTFSPMPGVLADRVTYATADGMRVPAVVYRPDPKVVHWKGRLPGIVIVNGHGGDKSSWYAFVSGMLFARAGAVVVTYDPLGSGERAADADGRPVPLAVPSQHDAFVDAPQWGQHLAGLMQMDAMQAVSYLLAQKDVDPGRIGMAGYSMGAFVAGIAGALDDRIHAVLLSGGGMYGGPHSYFDLSLLPCQGAPYRALATVGDRGAVLYALNAARGPMLVMNGDGDTVMKMADHPPAWFAAVRERAVALRGTDKDMFTTVLYPGISHRTSWVDLDGVLWLHKQLGFALWDEKAIRTAGVTHVSTWAKANGVVIAPNYMVEDREGGLDVVGTGYPGLHFSDLTVVPAAEWASSKEVYTYAGWAAKMKR